MGFPPAAVSWSGWLKQAFLGAPFLAPSSGYGGKQRYPKKVCLVAQTAAEIHFCFKVNGRRPYGLSRLRAGPPLRLPVHPHLPRRSSPIAAGLGTDDDDDMNDLRVNWIKVRESCATSASLSRPGSIFSSGMT